MTRNRHRHSIVLVQAEAGAAPGLEDALRCDEVNLRVFAQSEPAADFLRVIQPCVIVLNVDSDELLSRDFLARRLTLGPPASEIAIIAVGARSVELAQFVTCTLGRAEPHEALRRAALQQCEMR